MNFSLCLLKFNFALFSIALLISCAKDSDEETKKAQWTSSTLYVASGLAETRAQISSEGDVFLVWREDDSEVRADSEKDTLHTFAGTPAANQSHANLHNHMDLYTRPVMRAMRFDEDSASWSSAATLATGYWQKNKSGLLEKEFAGDNAKIVYDEKHPVFAGEFSIASNQNGDGFLVWIQLAESETTAGDADSHLKLMYTRFDASINSWSAPAEVTLASGTILKNEVKVSLNSDNSARLLWLAQDQSSNVTNAYSAVFDGAGLSGATQVSDGLSDVRQINIRNKSNADGVANWLQYVDTGNPDNKVLFVLHSRWYNSSSWSSAPVRISDLTSTVKNYQVASNASGALWLISEHGNSAAEDANRVTVFEFTGNITANLNSGLWSIGTNIQTGSSTSGVSKAHISVDSDGNALAAWLDATDNIRVNTYTNSNSSWLSSSFPITTDALLAQANITGSDFDELRLVSPSANRFMLSWQNTPGILNGASKIMYSAIYDLTAGSTSSVSQINTDPVAEVGQKHLLFVNGNAQMIWTSSHAAKTELIISVP